MPTLQEIENWASFAGSRAMNIFQGMRRVGMDRRIARYGLWVGLAAILAIALHAVTGASRESEPDRLGIIAYIQAKNLWIKELPNGSTQPIAIGDEFRQLSWSPSGQWLAYRQKDRLWVRRQDGSEAKPLTPAQEIAGQFAWDPGRDRIAYVSQTGQLFVASAPDWQPQSSLAKNTLGFVWSADGEKLLTNHEVLGDVSARQSARNIGLQVLRVDRRGETRQIPGATHAIAAGWSGDGQRILFWQAPMLSASLLADGLPLKQFAVGSSSSQALLPAVLVHPDFLAWSPDGSRVAIAAGAGRETWTNKQLVVADLKTGTLLPLTDKQTAAIAPNWSPDGKHIAYVASSDAGADAGGETAKTSLKQRRIWVTNDDSSNPRPLTQSQPGNREESPHWAGNSQQILFAQLTPSGNASLWLVNVAGKPVPEAVVQLRPLAQWDEFYGYIDWRNYFAWWQASS